MAHSSAYLRWRQRSEIILYQVHRLRIETQSPIAKMPQFSEMCELFDLFHCESSQ